MKILFVNQAFYPDVVSSAQHLTDLAVYLAKQNHSVAVLASRRGYANPAITFPKHEKYEGVEINRIGHLSFGRATKLARILDAFFLNLSFAWQLIWMPACDVLVTLTSPPMVAWFSLIYKKLKKCRLVYWVMDVNPDEAIEAGWLRKQSWKAKFLEACLRQVLAECDHVVALDEYMKERLLAKGLSESKITVIPPWSHDEDLVNIEHSQNPFRKEHGFSDKFIVMYSGNHSICHPLDTILEAALQLKGDSGIIFVFIGGGERVRDVLEFKRNHYLPNLYHLPYVERSRLKYTLSAADAHLVAMGNPFVGIVHPCKIYDILKIGRPFIFVGPRRSHIGDLMEGKRIGCQVEHGNPEGVVNAVQEYRQMNATDKANFGKEQMKITKNFFLRPLCEKMASVITQAP